MSTPDAVATTDTGTDILRLLTRWKRARGQWHRLVPHPVDLFLILALSAATVAGLSVLGAIEADDAPYAVRLKAWAWRTARL